MQIESGSRSSHQQCGADPQVSEANGSEFERLLEDLDVLGDVDCLDVLERATGERLLRLAPRQPRDVERADRQVVRDRQPVVDRHQRLHSLPALLVYLRLH